VITYAQMLATPKNLFRNIFNSKNSLKECEAFYPKTPSSLDRLVNLK